MPHPARISSDQILARARFMLEAHGVEAVTLRALARDLGVSAPSLYFHVENREDLLSQLIAAGLLEFGDLLARSGQVGRLQKRALAMASAYTAFAEANPQLFTLMFGPCVDEQRYPAQLGAAAAAPVLELAGEVAGEAEALGLASSLWALVHGYTVLRIAGQFRLNPNHEADFERALMSLIEGAQLAAARGGR